MSVDPLIEKAKAFATVHHAGVNRKWGTDPYITHPAAVAGMAESLRHATPVVIAAAWCHDVLEDARADGSRTCFNTLTQATSMDVACMVLDLTNRVQLGDLETPRHDQKRSDRNRLARTSLMTRQIKLCDRIHNLSTLSGASERHRNRYVQESFLLYQALTYRDAQDFDSWLLDGFQRVLAQVMENNLSREK